MKKLICILAMASCAFGANDTPADRLKAAADSLKVMGTAGDKGIPDSLFKKAVCAVVIPNVKKAGFIVGAKYGRGFVSCRLARGGWSSPSGVRVEGGSFGLQAGGVETDFVILVMNQKGMQRLLGSKFTIGGDATAAAGPVGRDTSAMTDASMAAEMLTWSVARGLFAGVSLSGATMRPDTDVNAKLYGAGAEPKTILTGDAKLSPEGKDLLANLAQYGGTQPPK